jgi:hypothetical protein
MVIGNARQSGFLHALVRVPPFLIVTSAAALAYTQAPKLEPTINGLFAPPPVVALPPPVRVIDQTPVAVIAPEPPPAPTVVATPPPVVPSVQHAARKPAPHMARVVRVAPPPVRRYVYSAYPRPYQPAYVPVPIPIPLFGGGGFFHRH